MLRDLTYAWRTALFLGLGGSAYFAYLSVDDQAKTAPLRWTAVGFIAAFLLDTVSALTIALYRRLFVPRPAPASPLDDIALTLFETRRGTREPVDFLSPYSRSVELIGRDAEFMSVRHFLAHPTTVLIRIMVGPMGTGKTRLALEVCEQAAANSWDAGFLTGTELSRFLDRHNAATWVPKRSTLIVIDDAAAHADALRIWVEELSQRIPQISYPLRIMLLERTAERDSGWWAEVFGSGAYGTSHLRGLLDPPLAMTIEPLGALTDKISILTSALEVLDPNHAFNIPVNDSEFRAEVSKISWGGEPLFLMMAAAEMNRLGYYKALQLSRGELAFALARREMDRVSQLAKARCEVSGRYSWLKGCPFGGIR